MKKLFKVETWDHPLVFLFALALALIPILYAVYCGAAALGVPLPDVTAQAAAA